MIHRVSRRALACALFATTALASPAIAQQATSAPPLHRTVDENGYDLLSGKFRFALTEATMGKGDGALSLVRYYGDSGYRDNWSNGLYLSGGGPLFVEFGDYSDSFVLSGTTYVNQKANGATLAKTASGYLYTAADGTKIQYGTRSPDNGLPLDGIACPQSAITGQCAIPVSVTKPSGMMFTLNWDFVDRCANLTVCDTGTSYYRFRGVSSSAGYNFTVNYASNAPGTSGAPPTNWYRRSAVTFANSAMACTTECPSIAYSAPGTVLTITDALSRVWQLTSPSALSGIRRPGETSDSTTVTYDTTTGLVSSIKRDGVTTNYSRSVAGNIVTVTATDPLGHSKVITGDLSIGQITSSKDELHRTTSYTFDTNGRPTKITLPEGNYRQLAYDSRGNVTTTTEVAKSGSGLANIITSAAYSSTCTNQVTCNEPTSTTDARGKITDYTYDATHGGVLTATQPAPTTGGIRPQTRYGYTQVTSASGALVYQVTSLSACQATASCTGASDETKEKIGYNSNLVPTSITRANGTGTLLATKAMTYDAAGNLLTVDGPLAGTADTTRYRYNADHELAGVTSPDPDGAGAMTPRAIRLTYRPDGQVSKQELGTVTDQSDTAWANFAANETVDVTFDANARPTQRKLSSGATDYALAQTDYDALGRVNCTAQRMNTAVYSALPASACALSTAGSFGSDQITKTIYDDAGEVTQIQDGVDTTEAANERSLTYSNNGLVSSLQDAENNLTTYTYDGFDRLSQTRYPSATKGAGTNASDYEQLSYDPASNVTSRRLHDGTSIAFTYDNLNRVTLKDLPGTEPDVTYAYDNLGRPASASQTGNVLTFAWDALGRKTSDGGPQGTVTFGYDLADEKTSIVYPGTTELTIGYEYLTTGELSRITQGSTSLAAYGYDNLGNRTSVTFGNGVTQAFSYDPVSRLSQLTNSLADANDLTATFAYSPSSQIASTVRTGDMYAWNGHTNVSMTSVANGLNQLTTVGGAPAAYDVKGNLTTDPTSSKTYGYSSENLLTSASGGVTLNYDPAMRLYQVAGAATTRFAYDGLDPIAEYDASNALQRRYVFDPVTDQPTVWYEGTGTGATNRRYLSNDERESIISVSNSSGASLGINSYDEYGKPGAANIGRFQYTGQMWVPEIGAYNYKARVYLAHLGIFAQTDPVAQQDSPNLYNYVLSDPVNLIDPLGLEAVVVIGRKPRRSKPSIGFCDSNPFSSLCGRGSPSPSGPSIGGKGDGGGGDVVVVIGKRHKKGKVTKTASQCAWEAGKKNAIGIGLDFAGLAANALAFEFTVPAAIAGAAIGAAGIGLGVAQHNAFVVAAAYAGKQSAVAGGLFKAGSRGATAATRVGWGALAFSALLDTYSTISYYQACMNGGGGDE